LEKVGSAKAIELEKKYGSFNYAPLPVVFSRGEGVYLWDPEGKKYLDCVGGFSAVSQGHCHPRIVKAVQEQVSTLTLVSRALYSDRMGLLGEYMHKLLGYERVLLMNTGAEAFDTGVKFARKWGYSVKGVAEGQAKILVAQDNFHGRTLGAVSASANESHHKFFGPVAPGFLRIPFNDLSALEAALKDHTVVAFIVEPIQGEAGINVPAEGYLRKAFDLCKAANTLFIADEIQTGLGRTGKLLACQHEGVKPDATLLGKALSGGTFPVSAVIADEPLMKMLQPGDHGSTFGGSPLACHVALESLKVIEEEKLAENAQRMGELFRSLVRELNSPKVEEVRGKGLLNAVALDLGGADKDAAFSLALADAGLIAKPTRPNVFRFAPPLVVNEAQIRDIGANLDKVLKKF
jgi:ornithine--oxo-acid transaminase